MEKQVTFHDLATHLRMLLESESYSQTTVKDMDFILNSFASYMDKNGFLVNAHGRRHLLQIVQGRPFLVAFPLALGSLGGYVYHALYAVLFRGVYSGFAAL